MIGDQLIALDRTRARADVSVAIVVGPTVTGADDAGLAALLIEHTVEVAIVAGVGPVTLWAAQSHEPSIDVVAAVMSVACVRQPEGELGERMFGALAAASGPAIAITADCLALAPEHLEAAAAALADGVDVVIAPNDGGGCGLIGVRRPEPALFAGITWRDGLKTAELRRAMTRLGIGWREPARIANAALSDHVERLSRSGLAALMS